MRQGTHIITLDNGYHIWTHTEGQGDIKCNNMSSLTHVFHLISSKLV